MSKKEEIYCQSASYYDIIYKWKDYDKEVQNFIKFSKTILKRPLTSLIDLGCGTGNHAIYFAQKGISVVGVDDSEHQIQVAEEKADQQGLEIRFIKSNMTEVQLNRQFDAAVVLFGGFGYILTDEEVIRFFNNVYRLVKPEGFLFFEFWHILGLRPSSNHNTVAEDGEIKVIRVNTTGFDVMTGVATMPMRHFVLKGNRFVEEFTEVHQLRTYSIPHLKCLIDQSPWKLINIYSAFLEDELKDFENIKPTYDDFRLYAVLQH